MRTLETIRTDLDTKLDQAAAEIELIQSCMSATMERTSIKVRAMSAMARAAASRLAEIRDAQNFYDTQTFMTMATRRLNQIRKERAARVKAKRMRREEMAREREAFLADMRLIQGHQAQAA